MSASSSAGKEYFPTLLVGASIHQFAMFRIGYARGVNSLDPLKFISQLNAAKPRARGHAFVEKYEDTLHVVSTTEQVARFDENEEIEVKGMSVYGSYARLVGALQSVKHVYYLPRMVGRTHPSFNLALDPTRPYHYLLNPTTTSPVNDVRKELEKFKVVAPDMTHEEYMKYLEKLSPNELAPWRKVPLHGSPEAENDKGFVDEYGPILPPNKSPAIRAKFDELCASLPRRTYKEFYHLYMSMLEQKLVEYDQAENDDVMDTVGEELVHLYDRIARLGACEVHERVRSFLTTFIPVPYFSTASVQTWPVQFHPYTTSREVKYTPRFAVEDMRAWFIARSKVHLDPNYNQDTCPYDPEDLLIFEETIAKIDQCGAFGKTECPFSIKEWPWNKK